MRISDWSSDVCSSDLVFSSIDCSTPIRIGVEQSRNLMTVRLAQTIGMEKVVDYAERFGVVDGMQPHLAYALGAGETTLLKMTAAYGMLVNGGKRIDPSLKIGRAHV